MPRKDPNLKREWDKEYYKANREKKLAYAREWRKTNRDYMQEYNFRYRLNNPDAQRDYVRSRVSSDPKFKLARVLRGRVSMALKRYTKGSRKGGSAVDLLGCSLEEAVAHIERQFLPGMSWDNHTIDGWHIDHIRPLVFFDLTCPEQCKIAFHYTNLQPLWWQDNLSKGANSMTVRKGTKKVDLETPNVEVAPVNPPVVLAAPVAEVAPLNPEINFSFKVKGYEGPINMNTDRIPDEVKDYLIKNAIKAYVQNRTSTATTAANKANEPFDQYDAAQANNPLQTLVPFPTGERVTVDYEDIIRKAIRALYDNSIGKRGDGTGKKKAERKDPLIAAVTRAVIQEVFEKNYALDNNYKYPMAGKEVGTDGIAYLRAKMEANVASGLATAEQMEYVLEAKYLKPARIMLGLENLTGKGKDTPAIL